MISLISITELVREINGRAIGFHFLAVLKELLPKIIEKSGFRTTEEIFDFLIGSGYELLPFPVRMALKKEVFVDVCRENKEKLFNIIKKTISE